MYSLDYSLKNSFGFFMSRPFCFVLGFFSSFPLKNRSVPLLHTRCVSVRIRKWWASLYHPRAFLLFSFYIATLFKRITMWLRLARAHSTHLSAGRVGQSWERREREGGGGSSAIQLAGPAGCERPRSGDPKDPKSSRKKEKKRRQQNVVPIYLYLLYSIYKGMSRQHF